ncbi:MAG: glycosyltransferase [Planctomycetes bacterium]|nr:glycosyltransferase [Planctomycetota bacterium]
MSNPAHTRCHVVVPTHTTRHLEACLTSLAAQSRPPASVVVTCDTDDPAIGDLLGSIPTASGGGIARIILARRAHTGIARLNQVRNNGLRALEATTTLADHDLIVLLDGDTMLAEDALERHASASAGGAELIIPFRVNLSEATTAGLGDGPITPAQLHQLITTSDGAALRRRQRRYERQLLQRRLLPEWTRAVKPHKPKVLGGHHGVSVRVLRAVNGYDELYTGYGYDDDDLTRRIYRLRPRVRVAVVVRECLSMHLWHPSRAPRRPTDAPGYARFSLKDLPTAARFGWSTPSDQPPVEVRVIGGA